MIENKDITGLGQWLATNAPTIYAVLISVFIAFLRIAMGHADGTARRSKLQMVIECSLCGAITLALSSGMELFGIPTTASTLLGGSVGFLGVEKIRSLADKFLDFKINKAP